MVGHLSSATGRVVRLGHDTEEDLGWRITPRYGHTDISVVRQSPIAIDVHGRHHSHLSGFVSGSRHHKRHTALAVERPHAIVDTTGQQHGEIEIDDIVVGKSKLAMRVLDVLDQLHDLIDFPVLMAVPESRPVLLRRIDSPASPGRGAQAPKMRTPP